MTKMEKTANISSPMGFLLGAFFGGLAFRAGVFGVNFLFRCAKDTRQM